MSPPTEFLIPDMSSTTGAGDGRSYPLPCPAVHTWAEGAGWTLRTDPSSRDTSAGRQVSHDLEVGSHKTWQQTPKDLVALGAPILVKDDVSFYPITEDRPDYQVAARIRALLTAGRLRTALKALEITAQTHPDSTILKRLRGLLKPARAYRVKREPIDQKAEREWLRMHAHEFRGQWIAIRNGVLLANGVDPFEVKERAKENAQGSFLLVRVTDEGRIC
jgi:hypothetical protein